MSYATAADLKARIPVSVYDEIYPGDVGAADDLAEAQAEVDGNVGIRYTLPLTGNASLLLVKGWTLTLTEERAYSRSAGSQYAEKVKLRVEQVRKYLEQVRTGEFKLPEAAEKSGGSAAFADIRPSVFGRDNMEGF